MYLGVNFGINDDLPQQFPLSSYHIAGSEPKEGLWEASSGIMYLPLLPVQWEDLPWRDAQLRRLVPYLRIHCYYFYLSPSVPLLVNYPRMSLQSSYPETNSSPSQQYCFFSSTNIIIWVWSCSRAAISAPSVVFPIYRRFASKEASGMLTMKVAFQIIFPSS